MCSLACAFPFILLLHCCYIAKSIIVSIISLYYSLDKLARFVDNDSIYEAAVKGMAFCRPPQLLLYSSKWPYSHSGAKQHNNATNFIILHTMCTVLADDGPISCTVLSMLDESGLIGVEMIFFCMRQLQSRSALAYLPCSSTRDQGMIDHTLT